MASFSNINTDDTDEGVRKSHAISLRGLIDWARAHFDRSLIVIQLFYFFFFAAFGSLFPLISIYFKQLGMSAIQCGILSGTRSFVECLATPFWNALAEKWKKAKSFLIASLVCSVSFTLGLGFVRPSPEGCLVQLPYYYSDYGQNETWLEETGGMALSIVGPYRASKYDDLKSVDMTRNLALNVKNKIGQTPLYLNTKLLVESPKPHKPDRPGRSDMRVFKSAPAYHDPTHYPPGSLVMPLYSTVVYSQTKINQIFILILLLVLFGELFACPSIPLVDALLAEKTQVPPSSLHGQQRTFGSIGWSLAMFCIGLALDNSSAFPDYPCLQPGYRERNYMVCFATYSVFMAFALFTATQLHFTYEGDQESMYFKMVKDKMAKTLLGRTTKSRSKLVNEEDPTDEQTWTPPDQTLGASGTTEQATSNEEILERQLGIKIGANGKTRNTEPKPVLNTPEESHMSFAQLKFTRWAKAMRQFCKPQLLAFLFVTWFMGLGVGQVFTFLFWHMQELDGSPTLFGIATVINHISEIVMFYFSTQTIEKIEFPAKDISLILSLNSGFTHAMVWVACSSYITQSFAPELRSTTQGFLKTVHYGLGRGLGACFGGLVISSYGSATMFRSYGAASAIVLLGFLVLNYILPIPTVSTEQEVIENQDGLSATGAASYGQSTDYNMAGSTAFGGSHFGQEVTHDYYSQQFQSQRPSTAEDRPF
ncbi:Major facilitator superfamily domain-containing protein 6 [Fasciola gigantica]|uniref:Major facilitator superfamily domain-containing protein 6 n=1 Tax=Fasciola gigantica TaxID=46835 RepID=A0A504Z9Y0_FASGI|nr:Major facilitator superfamily domain-containing protein 6 [Fasciola gigantica]